MNILRPTPGRKMTRREFLRYYGVASGALTFSPFFLERMTAVCQAAASLTRVYKVKNGNCFQNTAKLWQMLDGPAKYISPTDIVVIKGNAQWPNQGYTHTGVIKGVVDQILQIPGFSGEILICDNIQTETTAGAHGFDATSANRTNNWPDKNWNELAQDYRNNGKPVATVQWVNDSVWRSPPSLPYFSAWNPANGNGWGRSLFVYNTRNTYLSYPVFQSPLTSGRMIDLKNGVWENGSYTGRKIKAIFMPTLNNHGDNGAEDYAGMTSAVKSFFGATEIPSPWNGPLTNGYYHIHSSSYINYTSPTCCAQWAGDLVGRYIKAFYAPVLYITAAMYSGWYSRGRTSPSGTAAATNTVLACENPVSLDYVSGRDVISKCHSPAPTWLDPSTQNNNTWLQLLGCNGQGIGTLDPLQMDVITYDFNYPTATRLDIERKIRDFKAGNATTQDVKDVINQYMSHGDGRSSL
jgi:hypothetical protein